MRKIKDVMTTAIKVVAPDCTIQEAAQKMKDLDIGAIPVCDKDRIVGMLTDRDIVIRFVAKNDSASSTTVGEVMTKPIVYCYENDDVKAVALLMQQNQVRRMIVLDDDRRLCGIVTLGDLAVRFNRDRLTGDTLEKISTPSSRKSAA